MICKTFYESCSEYDGDSDSGSELEQFPLTDCEWEGDSDSGSELEQFPLTDCEWEGDSDSGSELEQFPLTDCEWEGDSDSGSELEQFPLSDCEWEGDSDSGSELEQFPLTDCEWEGDSDSGSELDQVPEISEWKLTYYYNVCLQMESVVGALENIAENLRETATKACKRNINTSDAQRDVKSVRTPVNSPRYLSPTQSSASKARRKASRPETSAREKACSAKSSSTARRRKESLSGKDPRGNGYLKPTLSSAKKRRCKSPLYRFPRTPLSLCA